MSKHICPGCFKETTPEIEPGTSRVMAYLCHGCRKQYPVCVMCSEVLPAHAKECKTCPKCYGPALELADEVDIGVGLQRHVYGYECPSCGEVSVPGLLAVTTGAPKGQREFGAMLDDDGFRPGPVVPVNESKGSYIAPSNSLPPPPPPTPAPLPPVNPLSELSEKEMNLLRLGLITFARSAETREEEKEAEELRQKLDRLAIHNSSQQVSVNFRWLLAQVDAIHEIVQRDKSGTWQQRAEQAVSGARALANECGALVHTLEEIYHTNDLLRIHLRAKTALAVRNQKRGGNV